MSVVIWKDGKRELCDPMYLQNQLNAGYTLEGHPEESESDSKDESENNPDDDIRAQAKELGIKSWHNKKIENLEREIEAILNDSD